MSIVDSTQRQLIRNRIHEVTDLALEINEGEAYRVTVWNEGVGGFINVFVYERARFGDMAAEVDWTTHGHMRANIPSASDDQWRHKVALELLESIAGKLQDLLRGGAQ